LHQETITSLPKPFERPLVMSSPGKCGPAASKGLFASLAARLEKAAGIKGASAVKSEETCLGHSPQDAFVAKGSQTRGWGTGTLLDADKRAYLNESRNQQLDAIDTPGWAPEKP
jgi:hypothetical protein